MHRRYVALLCFAALFTRPLPAQETSGTVIPAAARDRAAVLLARVISIHIENASLVRALAMIAARGQLELTYSPAQVPTQPTVSLVSDGITVGEALRRVLEGTGLDVIVLSSGRLAVGPKVVGIDDRPASRQGTATITGHVTDAALKTPLSEVSVRVEGTSLGTTANADGKYTIAGVAPGTYYVTARRVGYQALTKDITLSADQTAILDFGLTAAPTRLDEVVTTAVGQQRRYEVGNDISTINADSIAPTAPITSLTDLISARAPGVTVLENSGLTGSGEAIRIEGLTSLVLQNDPILIVDGVRQDNAAGGDIASYSIGRGSHPTPTRLNDIDFSDIESIDILKGPSASTEYGTDAANGVIVIMTKHGMAGTPQWKVSAEQTESGIPESFPNEYYSWGHTTDGANTAINCLLRGSYASTSGNCIVDSVTRWNPLNHAATSVFGTGDRGKYDLSVNGGSDAIRYFVSGGVTNETGVARMPPVFKELADTANLGLPSSAFNSNSEQQRSVRVNTSIKLGPTADVTATASYLATYQQSPDAGNLYSGVFVSPALSDPAHYYGYGLQGDNPLSVLTFLGSQNTSRMTGGLTGNWRPTGWFVGHVSTGLDHGSQWNEELNYPLANSAFEQYGGAAIGLEDGTTDVYSVDLRGTATASLGRAVRAVTSAGLQMVDTRTAGQAASASGITATNLTLNGVTNPTVTQLANRQATLGGYGEELVSFADRLFVTGALRIDAASGFGRTYATAAYPKASISWLALNRGTTTVRVRGAFGESGVQPLNGAALQLYTPAVANFAGTVESVSQLSWPGDPNLQPERSEEFEGGVDVGAWANRVSLALTGYSKATHDALVNQQLGIDLGSYPFEENIGEVQNTGVEASITVAILQGRSVTWDVGMTASVNHNKLISLAPGVTEQTAAGFYSEGDGLLQVPGYPLYGIWGSRITYADANHDGIIEMNEAAVAESASFLGPSLPTQEAALSSHIGLWRGAVTIGALVDYRGGYEIINGVATNADQNGNQSAENEPTAPLWLQARDVAGDLPPYGLVAPYAEDGSFIRFRELSLTYAVPRVVLRVLRVRSASVTGAVRNLALWTRYTGVDPEVSTSSGSNVQFSPTSGGDTVNNDVRADFGAVPLLRYWVVRLNLGL